MLPHAAEFRDLLARMYRAFNEREIDAVLAGLHPEVEWPNAWEGGWLHGRDAVRAYWLRQWSEIDPVVVPLGFEETAADTIAVTVHQMVRDLLGSLLSDAIVTHVYVRKDGLIQRMDVVGHPAERSSGDEPGP